jgi:hypothetical protein
MSALFALMLAAAPAQPQTPANPPTSDQIVVQGRDTQQTATDYVNKLLPATAGAEIGRFEEPVCPKVIGLAEPYNTQVTDRIRQVGKATNIDVAAGACTPNLLIITAPDKKLAIEQLRKARPTYVNGVGSDHLKHLAASAVPFAAWQATDLLGADGMPISAGSGESVTDVVGSGEASRSKHVDKYAGDFPRLMTTVSPSRLRTTTKPRVLSSVVIIETGALHNVTTRQLADFAFVRAMTPNAARQEAAPSSSILGLFNPGITPEGGPQSVTWWDVAFLKSLTNTRSDSNANIQQDEIREQMIREVKKQPAGQQ